MKPFRTLACAVAALAVAGPAGAQDERWYLSHLGGETCVALDDVGPDLGRLGHGAGPMKAPGDFERLFMEDLGKVIRMPMPNDTARYYLVMLPNGQAVSFKLIRGERRCKDVMAEMSK